jgi:hypothetical protein
VKPFAQEFVTAPASAAPRKPVRARVIQRKISSFRLLALRTVLCSILSHSMSLL